MEGYIYLTQQRELLVKDENGLVLEVMSTLADKKIINRLVHIDKEIKVEFTKSFEISKSCHNNIYCEGDESCMNCMEFYARIKNLV